MLLTLDQFFAQRNGQGWDYDGFPPDEPIQCVDLAKFYLHDCFGLNPGAWGNAHDYFEHPVPALQDAFDFIPNDPRDPNQVPPRGAIIVWSVALPGSGGCGHIAIVWQAVAGAVTFVSFDQNWGSKTSRLITHNWNYVLGWLIEKADRGAAASAPVAVIPQPEGDEMIATQDEAVKEYQLLRPNGGGSDAEIAATAGKRTYKEFLYSAQNEVAARDQNLQAQAQHMADMESIINSTNATVTQLRETIGNAQVSNADKQKALDAALAQIAADNAQMTTLHDQVTDLQKKIANPIASASAAIADVATIAQSKAGQSSGFLVAFFKFLLQLNLSKLFAKKQA